MEREAANCERQDNVQDAYFFLYRHAEFCMTKIATHPERKQPEFKPLIARVTKEVKEDLAKLEILKPEIQKRYQRYQESLRRIQESRQKERKENAVSEDVDREEVWEGLHGSTWGRSQLLNAGEHSDIALKLAHRELRRRGVAHAPDNSDIDDLSRKIQALGRQLDGGDSVPKPIQSRKEVYSYPSVPSHAREAQLEHNAFRPELPAKIDHVVGSAPAKPPKFRNDPQVPPVPYKAATPVLPAKDDLASSDYTFKPLAFSEAGEPLRPVFLPEELRSRFLTLAHPNTSRNLETCGILCGSLISGALFISHLVIPGQNSTSDTCDTTEEGDNALFDYVDGEQLMVCGWIHTHPSQTCFLSSRDLHTSVGYQVMLPESIAIVCAPKHSPDHGIFRLTDPPGKQAILGCHQTGLFHPHAQTNLYTDASRPGHVNELKGLQFQVVDLRAKG